MIAIRGATTVEHDCADEIKSSVRELLVKIVSDNSLTADDIICIMFSTTSDIHSYYPAKAARESGFFGCALYSSLEPDISGSLEKCIRVLVLAESDRKPVCCYLNRAASLRTDLTDKINIALDGPAGSGKSTIAKILAERFHLLYLDTGAMYRAVALACIRRGVNCKNRDEVQDILEKISVDVGYENGVQVTYLDGENVNEDIRTPAVSMCASDVSVHGCVRDKMVSLQRQIAAKGSCVLDGRDIGTNVLPDARFKFFITASAEVRASRRCEQNGVKGIPSDFDVILKQINERDTQDKTRTTAPLIKATDAIEVDTSNMSVEETVDFITEKIQERI